MRDLSHNNGGTHKMVSRKSGIVIFGMALLSMAFTNLAAQTFAEIFDKKESAVINITNNTIYNITSGDR